MRKWPKTESEDLGFVLKYCLAKPYLASEKRCPYAKTQLLAGFPKITTNDGDFEVADAMFLCRYPDREMPTHKAHLTSELTHCPDPARRNMIDALYAGEV